LKTETELMQKHLDNELYFQQIKRMSNQYTLLTLNVGVAPLNMMIDYYIKQGTLKPFVADTLKRQLALKTDINKCDVFLYWSSEIKDFLIKPVL
jgi:hypothetical protein